MREVSQVSTVSSPGSTAEAREMLRAVMSFYRASAAEMALVPAGTLKS